MAGVSAREVRAAVNPNPSPGDPGPAPRIVDLFQPVTSSKPPAAPITDRLAGPTNRPGQPVKLINGRTQDSEPLFAPATLPGYSPATRRRTGRVAGLLSGTQGGVVTLVASAVLLLMVTGITMSRNSSSTGSAVAEFPPDRPPATATPAINDPQPVTGAPASAPAGFTPHAYSADSSAISAPAQSPPAAHQPAQPTQQVVPASPAPPQAPDQGPVSPSPSSPPPSRATSEDPRYWTVSHSYSKNTEPQPTDRESCNCGPDHWGRPSRADQQREYRSPRDGYRTMSPAEESRDDRPSRFSERDRQADADGGHRASSERRSAGGHGHASR
jgi:hypothetical protein